MNFIPDRTTLDPVQSPTLPNAWGGDPYSATVCASCGTIGKAAQNPGNVCICYIANCHDFIRNRLKAEDRYAQISFL
jgi:hypothetical protein